MASRLDAALHPQSALEVLYQSALHQSPKSLRSTADNKSSSQHAPTTAIIPDDLDLCHLSRLQ